MRCTPTLLLGLTAASAPAAAVEVLPLLDTQLRYEQAAGDRLLGSNDAVLFHARPGVQLAAGPWKLEAVSDAGVALRRTEGPGTTSEGQRAPEAVRIGEFKLQYRGMARTLISIGRQPLGIAAADITGDRDGQQTFDAARIKWSGPPGLSADLAYAWSSSSLWASHDRAQPKTVPGENIFAQLAWESRLGTLSGYAYQIDQHPAEPTGFRLLNHVYGARFSGSRTIGEDIKLDYGMAIVRQTGALANAAGGAPTYWQIGNSFDLDDLAASQVAFRRFAANGISTSNGTSWTLSTSASRGRMKLGASYANFQPEGGPGAQPVSNLRLSMGLTF